MYEFACRSGRGNEETYLVEVLRFLGKAERTLANGLSFCADKNIRPLQNLSPRWLVDAARSGDAGREFRLAASLASIMAEPGGEVGPLRAHLEAVRQDGRRVEWAPGSTSAVWSSRALADNLAAVLLRRLMESEERGRTGRRAPGEDSSNGCSLRARLFAPLEDVVAFTNGDTDDDLVTDLLWALIGIDWRSKEFRWQRFRRELAEAFRFPSITPAPAAFGLIRLVLKTVRLNTTTLHVRGSTRRWRVAGKGERTELEITPTAEPFQLLARDALPSAEIAAARRLWSDLAAPFGWANRHGRGDNLSTGCKIDSKRLLAACLFPLSAASLTRLAGQVLNPPAVIT
jgi:CRISPR-associated protein Csx17